MKNSLTQNDIQILVNNLNVKNFNFVITKANKYLKNFPHEPILSNLLGLSYQGIGKNNKAKDVFIEGLKYNPTNISLKNNLAKSYGNLFEYQLAEKLYNEIIETNLSSRWCRYFDLIFQTTTRRQKCEDNNALPEDFLKEKDAESDNTESTKNTEEPKIAAAASWR